MLQLADFKSKNILIMGLGLHGGGVGAAEFFARLGSRVVVTDLKGKKLLKPSLVKLKRWKNITYRLGGHRAADFKHADYVIKNPGVREDSEFLAIARRASVPILSDVEIFFLACPAPIIGTTGTKGKSTATWLLGEFLKRGLDKRVWVGGNIRKSVLEFLPQVRRGDWVVLELSSFQLDSLKSQRMSPKIAIITNIFPDHLNRYHGMRSYIASKSAVFRYQRRGDTLFINARDPLLRRIARSAPAGVVRFDPKKVLRPFAAALLPTIAPYHAPNIAAAIAVAKRLRVGDRVIREVLRRFKGMPGRMELVRTVRGVEFINDTTATNPGASEQAVVATKRRIGRKGLHVIAGGYDKGLPVGEFVRALRRCAASVIFLPGTATKKMRPEIKSRESKVRTHEARTMREAASTAFRHAKAGDVVLLSPGAASFGLFQHEFERGDAFVKAVKRLKSGHRTRR